ncbi:uncharacterized protein LOC110807939 [Carica papaya]|uniref:uncharacterized protein LOC110807939 n=1 Tax=Carica papaya TaxID=3649 RepID=UPI000B8CB744|nr:uncharacterized protein LOC110807939 [Carica papaya]
MKLKLAEQIGLTEKQVSGWFCHRRLKDKRLLRDEAYAFGRQDRSSGVIQDRGSGLWQDSCGSTKQGDYRNADLREVESRRLYGHDIFAGDVSYEHRSPCTGNVGGMDSTSSESSSSLQDRFLYQKEGPYDSGYVKENKAIMDMTRTNSTGYKPSGYLKVKGEIENAAITAVKRQLGRHYQEDGPLLGVEFDPLPRGAFESLNTDPVNSAIYNRNSRRTQSPDVSGFTKYPSLDPRFEAYNSKMSSQDPDLEGANHNTMPGSGFQDRKSHRQLKPRSPLIYSSSYAGQKTSLDLYEESAQETTLCNSKRSRNRIRSKHDPEVMRSDPLSRHHSPYGGIVSGEQSRPLLHDVDKVCSKFVQKGEYFSRPSNLVLGFSKSPDIKERGISTGIEKMEKLYGGRKSIKECGDRNLLKMHPTNGMRAVKRGGIEFSGQDQVTELSYGDISPPKHHIKGSAAEMPSSFSEDETAETSSSLD